MAASASVLTSHDLFLHVRVLIGVVLGLSVGKLLGGISTFIEHPGRWRASAVHLIWVFWALISVMGFWWWEFRLANVETWSFGSYCFIFLYSACYYLIASILFPEKMDAHASYAEYFKSRRRWVFGIIALTYLLDIGDTWLKGTAYMASLGTAFEIRLISAIIGCSLGAAISNQRFHAVLAVAAVIYQVVWLVAFYDRMI